MASPARAIPASTRPRKRGTSWVRKNKIYSDVTDDGFVAHWRPKVEGVAKKMIRDYRLPESNYDDLLSDGMLALVRIPRQARWNSIYVWRGIVNGMRDGLRKATRRFERFEVWSNVPDVIATKENTADDLSLDKLVRELRGREGFVTRLYLEGKTEREIARQLGGSVQEARMFLSAAVATMRKVARVEKQLDEAFPCSRDSEVEHYKKVLKDLPK